MVIHLGSQIRLAYQWWDEERKVWFKSESFNPLQDRDKERPKFHTVLVQVPNKGWRSEQIPIKDDEPVMRNVEDIRRILRDNKNLQLGIETHDGKVVRVLSLEEISHQCPAFIPAFYDEDRSNDDEEIIANYRSHITSSPPACRDFPWYAENYWHRFMGGDTEVRIPNSEEWLQVDTLEFPRCIPCGDGFVTMEQEHGYGDSTVNEDGTVRFDYFPPLYKLVLAEPCELSIVAGYRDELLQFVMRGKEI